MGNGYGSIDDLPATDNQFGYIRRLGGRIPEQGLTRNQASKVISDLENIKKQPTEAFHAPVRRP